MKKLLIVSFLSLILTLGINVCEANAQTAYGISIVRYNNSTRIVDGYSGTWLDYYAGLYYDPEVSGDLYRTDNPETSLDSGYSTGWADIIPAEVYLDTTNYQQGKTYCTYSQHFVLAYYFYTATNRWLDPFRYNTFIYTGGGPWGGYPFSYFYVQPRRYRLGWTQACIPIPVTPPTPSPTPPIPTPTPTPCDPSLGGSCQGENMNVRISPTVIKPSGVTGGTNKAKVTVRITNWQGNAVANRDVRLSLILRPYQNDLGGHIKSQHIGNKPLGKLEKISGTTNSNGYFETYYSPPHVSGGVGIDGVSSRSRDSEASILVGNTSLYPLQPGENYQLIGQTAAHPVNHYGTERAVNAHPLIANDYKAQFYGNNPIPENDKLAYNDMSLIWGGKFDLAKKWSAAGAHAEHREGINTDVRCCSNPGNVPRDRWAALKEIFRNRGSNRTNDETASRTAPHWHLRFLNFLAQGEFSQMQNGIRQELNPFGEFNPAPVTTHYFVELVWWSVFDRESTQEEWLNWHTQIAEAKAQGSSQLLGKAKIFEQELFSSSEYVTRSRTSEEFIEDVFNSHLLRVPSQAEKDYWLSYLQNLPPSIPQQRKRMRLVSEIELLTEFEEIVLGIVDETTPPEPTPTP